MPKINGTITTHLHKRITVDYCELVTYYPPNTGEIVAMVFPGNDEFYLNVIDMGNREVLVHDAFDSVEAALDDLDRRYGHLKEKAQ